MARRLADDQAAYRVPFWVRVRRVIIWPIFKSIFRIFSRVSIQGREHIPTEGGYVIVYNHVSLIEPPFILTYWPQNPEAVAGDDVFYRPRQGFLVRLYGAIPVHRERYDRQVIKTMLNILRAGKPLMLAPEGGRSHSGALRRARPGVAYLVDQARVPIVPVAILGGSDSFLARAFFRLERPPLEMRIGEPFTLKPIEARGGERRNARQHNADQVMLRLAALLPAEYHGEYSVEGFAEKSRPLS